MSFVNNLLALFGSASPNPGFQPTDFKLLFDAISMPHGVNTDNAITASATQTQAGGYLFNAGFGRVTVAASNDALTINRAAGGGKWFVLINDSGQTIKVFPKSGDKINDAAVDAAVDIADNTISLYVSTVKGLWFGGAVALET